MKNAIYVNHTHTHIDIYISKLSIYRIFCVSWPCSVDALPYPLFFFIAATRETAFLHAISAAAITHELTVQCRQNRIPGCRCGKTRKQPKGKSEWQWGGCSDDIKFGEKETRRFIDKLEKGNDARTAFNLHNNQVGRKVGYLLFFFSVSLSVKNVNSNLIIITVLWLYAIPLFFQKLKEKQIYSGCLLSWRQPRIDVPFFIHPI